MSVLCWFDHFLYSRTEICQIFRCFFRKFKISERHFEINWPLDHRGQSCGWMRYYQMIWKKIASKKWPVPTNIENVKSFTATFLAATLQILHTHVTKLLLYRCPLGIIQILRKHMTGWVGGLENPPDHAYVIFEWSLTNSIQNSLILILVM